MSAHAGTTRSPTTQSKRLADTVSGWAMSSTHPKIMIQPGTKTLRVSPTNLAGTGILTVAKSRLATRGDTKGTGSPDDRGRGAMSFTRTTTPDAMPRPAVGSVSTSEEDDDDDDEQERRHRDDDGVTAGHLDVGHAR
jgi:hypothetical protein